MNKKTIWYISKYFAPGLDVNIGTRSWFLLKHLAAKDWNVVAITSNSNQLANAPIFKSSMLIRNISGVRVVWLKTIPYKVAKSMRRVLSWVHFEWNVLFFCGKVKPKPDIIIISSPSLLTVFSGFLLSRLYGAKFVFEVRDIWPLTLTEEGGYSKSNIFIRIFGAIEILGYKYSDLIIGTMPNLKSHVKNVTKTNTPVVCIPMGVDDEMIASESNLSLDYVEKYLQQDFFNVVYAGTIGIANALETFFRAAELTQKNNKIRFVVIGNGPLLDHYKNKYGRCRNILFFPQVPKTEVSSLLTKASLVYFGTFNSEVWDYGQSLNKVIDYMLSARPILASYSGYPSMINESGCGFFVEAEDPVLLSKKILELSQYSDEYLSKIGINGRNWLLENRMYTSLSLQLSRLLNDLLSKGR